jgi:hypothetical protein
MAHPFAMRRGQGRVLGAHGTWRHSVGRMVVARPCLEEEEDGGSFGPGGPILQLGQPGKLGQKKESRLGCQASWVEKEFLGRD